MLEASFSMHMANLYLRKVVKKIIHTAVPDYSRYTRSGEERIESWNGAVKRLSREIDRSADSTSLCNSE